MEVFLSDLVAAQRKECLEVFAIVHGDQLQNDPPWLVRVAVLFKLLFTPIAPSFAWRLRRTIKRFRPDVLHIHMPNASAFWALLLPTARALPWVVHWQSDVLVEPLANNTRHPGLSLAYPLYRPFEHAVLDKADLIIASSPPYLEQSEPLQAWKYKCVVVPLGLNLDRLPAQPIAQRTADLPWTAGALRLLSLGRLTYYKDFGTLIKAVAGLYGVELAIAGEGAERPRLEALIERLGLRGRMRLLGAVPEAEKVRLLQTCDVFCLASCERTEAFGIAVLEAMRYGKPCIVSDLAGSGMPWLVRTSGAGILAEVGNPDDWRNAIIRLQNSPELRAKLGKAGADAVDKRFSIARVARSIDALYPVERPRARNTASAKRTLVVIPARNEVASIGAVISDLHRAGWQDVLVVNDQSSDDTAMIARGLGAVVLSPVLRLGAWGAMQTGIRYAYRHGFDSVITMDADGQHEVAAIPALRAASDRADVVIGACPTRGSSARRMAWAWFRRLAGFSLSDLTSGFRFYNRGAIETLAGEEATLLDYQDVGVLLLLRRQGFRIAEVPVDMNLRQTGKSRIFYSWFAVAFYMAETTLLCLARWGHGRHKLE
ncbi:MAG: glycosyltransferase [Methylococcus sp.]|nr:glycosyltransferase [Methylococcus sp.]